MKSIKILMLLLLSGSLSLISCNDVLDKAPDGSITMEEVFKDPVKVSALLNSCYNNVPQKGLTYFFFESLISAMTDDAWTSADREGQLVQAMYDGTSASAGYHPIRDMHDGHGAANNAYWDRYWTQIRLCSQFIENIDNSAVNSEEERSRMKAEAHVLRAFFYSELIKWFGKVPILRETRGIADDFSTLRREPVYDIVQFIAEDCDIALNTASLPWRIRTDQEAPRATKALAHAIKSKMLLFAASPLFNEGENYWEEAYLANKKAVEELKSNGYELYTVCSNEATYGTGPQAAYHELVTTRVQYTANPNDKETIWQHTHGEVFVWHINYLGCADNMHKCGICPSQELVDAYETINGETVLELEKPYKDEKHITPNYNTSNTMYDPNNPYENRDPRFYASVVYNGAKVQLDGVDSTIHIYFNDNSYTAGSQYKLEHDGLGKHTRTGYYHKKFVVPGSGNKHQINCPPWKFFRLAEIILNYAEAAAEAGHFAEATTAVNEVRARVSMPPIPGGLIKEDLILRIRNERRVEFAFEEHRYFDLRRWQKPEGSLSETCKWLTAMYAVKNLDGTYSYTRKSVRETFRFGYENKDMLLPINLDECSRMEGITQVKWQNPGW